MKQRTKAEILNQIETEHGRLVKHLQTLNEASLCQIGVRPTPEPGQSCKDVLGHLTAWEERMRDCVSTFLATGTLPEYPTTAQFNAQVYLARKDLATSPVGQLIGYNTYNHYQWANKVIRAWIKLQNL